MIRKFSDLSIRIKLVFILSFTAITALLAVSTLLFLTSIQTVKKYEIANIKQLAEVSSLSISAALIFNDKIKATEMLSSLAANSDIMAAFIYDQNHTIFVRYFNKNLNKYQQDKLIHYSQPKLNSLQQSTKSKYFSWDKFEVLVPIKIDSENIGQIHIISNKNHFTQQVKNLMRSLAIVIGTSVAIIFILAYFFQRIFANPIYALLNVMQAVSKNKSYDFSKELQRNDEYGTLFNGFNTMLQKLKQIEEELIIAKEKSDQANQTKSYFLANMSHEIRTPMNAVIGLSQLALKTELNFKQANYLNKIHISAKGLLAIINDILDFSKIEAGMLKIEAKEFNLAAVIEEVININNTQAVAKNLHLYCSINPSTPHFLIGDSLRLRQIMINLISNAIKFTEYGDIKIIIKTEPHDNTDFLKLIVTVQDTGIGISKENLAHLFEPFNQVDITTTRRFGGTGLGLAICKQLIELMGGNITAESDFDLGSTFTFNCNVGVQNKQNEIIIDTKTPKIENSSNDLQYLKNSSILLAEDNEINQLVAIEFLEDAGVNVDIAGNGREAVTKALDENSNYDAILMDIQMPKMDGIEATIMIRKERKKIPIIAMTAHAMDAEKQRCYQAGMNDHISKPIESEAFYKTLSHWIKQYKL